MVVVWNVFLVFLLWFTVKLSFCESLPSTISLLPHEAELNQECRLHSDLCVGIPYCLENETFVGFECRYLAFISLLTPWMFRFLQTAYSITTFLFEILTYVWVGSYDQDVLIFFGSLLKRAEDSVTWRQSWPVYLLEDPERQARLWCPSPSVCALPLHMWIWASPCFPFQLFFCLKLECVY